MSKLSKNLGLIVGSMTGVAASWTLSAPHSPLKQKIPEKSVRSVEVLPNLTVVRKNKNYHIHHWVYFSFVYGVLFAVRNFKGKRFINGFVLGIIIQGLTYGDRFQLRTAAEAAVLKDR